MIGKKLPAVFRIVFAIWVILQVFLVVKYWDMPNHDDALAYVKLASECIARGTWYPDMHNQYEDFIFGPGYVNLLIGIHHLFGSFSFVRLLNLLMNIAMVFEIRKLAGRMFSDKTGYYAAILYMLIFSNLYAPIAVLTDLPFTFLLLTALLLCNVRRLFPVAVAGVLSLWLTGFRPLAIVFLFVFCSFSSCKSVLMAVLCRFDPAACLDCFPDRTECEEENRSFCLSSGIRRL